MNDTILHGGTVSTGVASVLTNGIPTATRGMPCLCEKHGPAGIVLGRVDVLVGGRPIARLRDYVSCSPPDAVPEDPSWAGPGASKSGSGGKAKGEAHLLRKHYNGQNEDGSRKWGFEEVYGEATLDVEARKAEANLGRLTAYYEVDNGLWIERTEIEFKAGVSGETKSLADNLFNEKGEVSLAAVSKLEAAAEAKVTRSYVVNVGDRVVTAKGSLKVGASESVGPSIPVKGNYNTITGDGSVSGEGDLSGFGAEGELGVAKRNDPVAMAANKITSASANVLVG